MVKMKYINCCECKEEIPFGEVAYKNWEYFRGVMCESCFDDFVSDIKKESEFELDETCEEFCERFVPDEEV